MSFKGGLIVRSVILHLALFLIGIKLTYEQGCENICEFANSYRKTLVEGDAFAGICKASITTTFLSSFRIDGSGHFVINAKDQLIMMAAIQMAGEACTHYNKVEWKWKALDSNDENVFKAKHVQNVSFTKSYLRLPKNALRDGKYTIRISAVVTPVDDFEDIREKNMISKKFELVVMKSKIVVRLGGANKRKINKETKFRIDASDSYDPDGKLKLSDMIFRFMCEEMEIEKEDFKDSHLILTKRDCDKKNDGNLNSLISLERVNTAVPRRTMCKCLDTPILITDRPFIELNAQDFNHDKKYHFRVSVHPKSSPNTYSISDQMIYFVSSQTRTINIKCVYNCNGGISQTENLRLHAYCENCLETFDIEWHVNDTNVIWEGKERNNGSMKSDPNLLIYGGILRNSPVVISLMHPWSSPNNWIAQFIAPLHKRILPPPNTCKVYPESGVELLTDFSIMCDPFPVTYDNQVYQYYKYSQQTGTLDEVILHYSNSLKVDHLLLAAGQNEFNYKTKIIVEAFDLSGTKISVSTLVRVYPLGAEACFKEMLRCISDLIWWPSQDNNFFSNLIQIGLIQNAIQIFHVITLMLNEMIPINPDDGFHLAQKSKLRWSLLNMTQNIPFVTFTTLDQVANWLRSIFLMMPNEIIPHLADSGLNTTLYLVGQAKHLEDFARQESRVSELTKNIVLLLESMINLARCDDIIDCRTLVKTVNDYFNITERQKLEQEKIKKYHLAVQSILSILVDMLLKYAAVNEKAQTLSNYYFDTLYRKVEFGELKQGSLGFAGQQGPFITIPSGNKGFNPSVPLIVQITKFSRDIINVRNFTSHSVDPVEILVKDALSGKQIKDEIGPIDIMMPIGLIDMEKLKWGKYMTMLITEPRYKIPLEVLETRVKLSNRPGVLRVWVTPINKHHELQVNLSVNALPVLKNLNYFNNKALFARIDSRPSATDVFDVYTFLIPTRKTTARIFNDSRTSGRPPLLFYRHSAAVLKCLHFDIDNGYWDETSCHSVDDVENADYLHCRCKSLSIYSGELEVQSNTRKRNISDLYRDVRQPSDQPSDRFSFSSHLPFNYVHFIVFGLIWIIFLILIVIVFVQERTLMYRPIVTVVKDNDPFFKYSYLITMATRSGLNKCLVGVELFGSDGNSAVHVMADTDEKMLEQGDECNFLIVTHNSLGSLKNLSLVHTTLDKSQVRKWFLYYITVIDLQTSHSWLFSCNREIESKGDRAECFEIREQSISRDSMLRQRIIRRFKDDLLWTSFLFPSRSTGISKFQRVSVVFLLTLLAFFFNILLRGVPMSNPEDFIGPYPFEFRFFDFSVAVITAIILVPCAIITWFMLKKFHSANKWIVYFEIDCNWKNRLAWMEEEDLCICFRQDKYSVAPELYSAINNPSSRRKNYMNIKTNRIVSPESSGTLIPRQVVSVESVQIGEKPTELDEKPFSKRNSGKSSTGDHTHATASTKPAQKHCIKILDEPSVSGETCIIISVIWMFIIVLAMLNTLLGVRYSETNTLMWTFSSLLAILFCAFIFHPLAIIITAVICPITDPIYRRKARWLSRHLCRIHERRTQLLLENGGSRDAYIEYLKQLRGIIMREEYAPRLECEER